MKRPSSTKSLRKRAGNWLQELRLRAGLTQLELATRLGVRHCAFISQIENGFSRVPHDRFAVWAQALGVQPSHFGKRLLFFYEPELHRVLYEDGSGPPDAVPDGAKHSLPRADETGGHGRVARNKRSVQAAGIRMVRRAGSADQ